MIVMKSLALILLFVIYVFGAGEYCAVDEHCGPGEKCLREERVPMKKCVPLRRGPSSDKPLPPFPVRYCRHWYDCKWYDGESCNKWGWCSYF